MGIYTAGFARILALSLWLSGLLLLSACSGTNQSPLNFNAVAIAEDGTTLTLTLVSDDDGQSIDTITRTRKGRVIANLEDINGNPMPDFLIRFNSQQTTISPGTSITTDSLGEAQVTLSPLDQGGTGSVVVSVDLGTETLSANVAFYIDLNSSNTSVGSIEFVDASPTTIVLKGTGGAGLSEHSHVRFRVIGKDGLPLVSNTVYFSLSTSLGGITLSTSSATSDANGLVSTVVQSGTLPTVVRITAATSSVDSGGNPVTIYTYSDQLTISTGIADQDSFTLSLSAINPEAADYVGEEVVVTARLADHFNNPVPDGTTVYFTTEGGAIEPSCLTVKGVCQVSWFSQQPIPSDHRATILATALGNESFIDADGDGRYSNSDGEPFTDQNGNGFFDEPFNDANSNGLFDEPYVDTNSNGQWDIDERFTDHNRNGVRDGSSATAGETSFTDINGNGVYDGSGTIPAGESYVDIDGNVAFNPYGFADLGEPFVDYNENDTRDGHEPYVDTNNNGAFDATGDTIYNGILCTTGANCNAALPVHIRASQLIIMASSHIYITSGTWDLTTIYGSNDPNYAASIISAIDVSGGPVPFYVNFNDTAGQLPPAGSVMSITSSVGTLSGDTSYTFGNSSNLNDNPTFRVVAYDDDVLTNASGQIKISITTPKGNVTTLFLDIST